MLQSCPSLHGHGLVSARFLPLPMPTQPGAPDPSPGSSKLHYSNYTIWSSTIPVNFHLGCHLFQPILFAVCYFTPSWPVKDGLPLYSSS
uniref:Uncharacterized protein n=1 Tax=Anguilla anguilla TaxID=7936 RepID=A0A0E9RDY0_ANGAN